MSTAELGIVVTTTGIADKAIPELTSLNVVTGKTEAAVTKLAQTTATQTAAAGASVTKLTTTTTAQLGATAAQAESFGKRLEQALNIKTRAPSNDVLDFNKMSAGIDALRNKYAPLQAASERYERTLTEIRMAQTLGAISTDEMTAALNRETIAFQRLQEQQQKLASQSGKQGVNDNRAGAGGATGRSMMQTNLMYQFQDIAVTTAMGMNPAMIALQQGTQLAAGMQMMGGAKEGVMGLVGALKSMFSISSILPIAVIGIGAAFVQWMSKADKDVKTLDEAMKHHTETMKILKSVYGATAEAAGDLFTGVGDAIARSMSAVDIKALRVQAMELGSAFATRLSAEGGFLGLGTGGNMGAFAVNAQNSNFDIWRKQIDDLVQAARDGEDGLDAFNKGVQKVFVEQMSKVDAGQSVELLAEMRDNLLAMGEAAFTVSGKFEPISAQINKLGLAFADRDLSAQKLQEIIAEMEKIGQSQDIADITAEAVSWGLELYKVLDALKQIEAVQARVKKLNEDFRRSEITSDSGVRGYNEQVERERAREDAVIAAKRQAAAARTDAERIAAAEAQAAAANIVKGDPRDREIRLAGEEEALQIQREHADATRTRTQAMDDLLAKQELEMALIGKTAGEQAALREEYQRTHEYKMYALEHGIEMDQAVLDLIKQTTAAYGEQVDMLNQKKLVQDLIFERSLIGLSAEEKAIATKLRDTGLSTTGPEANMMRENAAMERAAADRQDWSDMGRDSARDFLGSMVDAIVEGGDDMGEALIKAMVGAAQRTLDKIIDKLLDQIIEALFGVPGTGGAAGGGGGGVVGDFIGSILGGKGGGAATSGAGGVVGGSSVLGLAPYEEMVAFAKEAAIARNIDPSVALNLMKHEGLQPGIWQSLVGKKQGRQETSYGAMQLLKGGGLGDAFERQTGLNVADPRTWRQNIEFGLNEAARKRSWGDWYGRGPAGIGVSEGLANARQVPLSGAFGGGGGVVSSVVSGAGNIVGDAGVTAQGIKLSEVMTSTGQSFKVATAHVDKFSGFLKELEGTGYKISDVGEGGYSFRKVKGTDNLSKHSFGEAIDINPAKNPWKDTLQTDMPPGVGAMAKKWGLKWGGEFNKPDAMHFQVDKSLESLDKNIVSMTAVTAKSATSLSALTGASQTTIASLSDMAGGMDKLGQIMSSFSASPTGGGSSWFGGLSKMFGGSGGAIGSMMSISPQATMAILSGGGGLYHEGNVGVSSFVTRHFDDMSVFNGAPRFHNGNVKKQLKGFASDEYPAVLRKGELVFPDKAAVKKFMMPEIISDVWGKAPRFHNGNTTTTNIFDPDAFKKAVKDGTIETDKGIVGMLISLKDYMKKETATPAYTDDGTVIRYKGENTINKFGELVDKAGKLVWGTSNPDVPTPVGLMADPQPGGWDMGKFMKTFEKAPKLHDGNVKKFGADEYPAVLKRGEPVFPSMGAAQAMMGGNAFVNVHNYSGAKVSTKQTKDNKGMTIDVMVDRLVASQIDQRGTASNNAIRSKFSVTERLRPR